MKYCKRCDRELPLAKFRKDGKGHSWCRICQNEYNRQWYQNNRERGLRWRKNGHLKRSYGITLDEYESMAKEQNNRCAICGKEDSGKNQHGSKKLAVDHDHTKGGVRGLLCENCNRGIGMFKDDVGLLNKAIDYLNHWY